MKDAGDSSEQRSYCVGSHQTNRPVSSVTNFKNYGFGCGAISIGLNGLIVPKRPLSTREDIIIVLDELYASVQVGG